MMRLARKIADECRAYTMLPPERLIQTIEYMLTLAGSSAFPNGSVVECGTWKGGMALAATRIFGVGRRFAFYDSFEGLPDPSSRDGEDSHWWAAHPEHPRNFNNCRAERHEMEAVVRRLRPGFDISIFAGWFEQTFWPAEVAPVAWAHLDCDWYDSIYLCLERLWPHMAIGGVVAIDDYYDWEGCRRAVHDFLSHHNAREAIVRIGTHGGIAITRLGGWRLEESPHLK